MVSQINSSSIDGTYPVAGKDNDSAGFRNNFTAIKNSLQFAHDEISLLQAESANKSDAITDFNTNTITRATFVNCSDKVYPINSSDTTINYTNGSYQKFTLNSNDKIFTLTGFPISGAYGKITVELKTDIQVRSVVFSSGSGNFKKSSAIIDMLTAVQCSSTNSSTDTITTATNHNLIENQPITFSGTTISGSNIVVGTTYFVKSVVSPTQFSLSSTTSDSGAGTTFQLGTGTGTTLYTNPKIIIPNATDPVIFEFWSTDNGSTILWDYRGMFV